MKTSPEAAGTAPAARPGRIAWAVALVAGLAALLACGMPDMALEERQPLVKNQPFQGTQSDMDYALAYRYVFHAGGAAGPDRLEFSGDLTPNRGLNTLIVRLHFLDAAGRVLATHVLYAPGTGAGAARTAINQTLEVPPRTTGIAFSDFARSKMLL